MTIDHEYTNKTYVGEISFKPQLEKNEQISINEGPVGIEHVSKYNDTISKYNNKAYVSEYRIDRNFGLENQLVNTAPQKTTNTYDVKVMQVKGAVKKLVVDKKIQESNPFVRYALNNTDEVFEIIKNGHLNEEIKVMIQEGQIDSLVLYELLQKGQIPTELIMAVNV